VRRKTVRLIVVLALRLLATPLTADAQPWAKIPRVAVLSPATPATASEPAVPKHGLDACRQGLRDLGYVEGQTILLEYRFAEWQWEPLPGLAAEWVRLQPDGIVTNMPPRGAGRQAGHHDDPYRGRNHG
jgi:putative tryptophan/tyrosine transport system substrate-binding protein